MRKTLGFLLFAGMAAIATPAFAPSGLADFSKALKDAQTLKANYTVQAIGGARDRYTVELQKPNLFHIETPTQILVSDGKNLTTYDKSDGVFYKQPVTQAAIGSVLNPEPLNIWAGFFNSQALKAVSSKNLGTKSLGGQTLDGVEATFDKESNRVVTYFLHPTDKVARLAQIDLKKSGEKTTLVINAKDVQVGGPLSADAFAFKAPEGSKETTMEEMASSRWLTDIEEAKSLAKKTGKKIFMDCMASWCVPCKILDAEVLDTDRFKSIAKEKLILLRIDVDVQKDVASSYQIEAMPTQMVLDSDGRVLAKTVGYGGPDAFYSFLMPNLG